VSNLATLIRHPELHRVLRFGVTGGASFVVDFGSLVVAHSFFHWPLTFSLVFAYALGGCVHYSLTRWWVFNAGRSGAGEVGRVVRYLMLAGVNIVATLLVVPALTHLGLDYRLAKLLCTGLLFGMNYLITPRFVMPAEPRQPVPPAV
jgi:putative flippase GtrA